MKLNQLFEQSDSLKKALRNAVDAFHNNKHKYKNNGIAIANIARSFKLEPRQLSLELHRLKKAHKKPIKKDKPTQDTQKDTNIKGKAKESQGTLFPDNPRINLEHRTN